jgi:hypothetical protein
MLRQSLLTGRFARSVATIATVCAVGAATLTATASPASASLLGGCRARTTSSPFAAWGDPSSYFLMSGGSFESGAGRWKLSSSSSSSSSSVVDDNEGYFVNGQDDTQSLSVPGGAQATSPSICVDMGENTVRFFVKSSVGAGSSLHVDAYVANPLTGLVLSTGVDIDGADAAGTWSATDQVVIPNLLGGVLGTQRLTLVFTPTGAPATWNIDDVYVDPFKSH